MPRKDEAEDGSDGPGERRVEDEAGFSGVVGRGEGPVRVEIAVSKLACGFHPVEEVEVEVVAAGAAVDEKWQDGDERG